MEKIMERKKMQEIELREYDETPMEAEIIVSNRLPSLDYDTKMEMADHEHCQWAHGWMADHKNGQSSHLNNVGLRLQRVAEHTARCISVSDHGFCYAALAWMRVTFEAIGVEIQVDPYTVVIPYEPREEGETKEAVGMEVV